MKQLVIMLLLSLMLTGCGQQNEPSAPVTQPEETAPTEQTQSFYRPDTPAEQGTAGAVRAFDMGQAVTGIAPFGEKLLVCAGDRTLLLLDGTTLEIQKQRDLEGDFGWNTAGFLTGESRIGYFDTSDNSYVILNGELVTESATQLPRELGSNPIISADFQTIYYTVGAEIRGMDLSTGITRLLRQEGAGSILLEGLAFDNDVLRYVRTDADGREQTRFISTKDGSVYFTATYHDLMPHWGNWYAAAPQLRHPFGAFQRIITGKRDGTIHMLQPRQPWDRVISPGESYVITQNLGNVGLSLTVYDLETGVPKAEVTLPQQMEVFSGGCIQGDMIWLWQDGQTEFYRWDTTKTPPQDTTSILREFASVTDDPETALEEVNLQAEELGKRYGVDIIFGENGSRTPGLDYSTVPDYRPEMYEAALGLLEEAMDQLPNDFLEQVGMRGKKGKQGTLQIRLVDDYDPVVGALPGTGSCEFVDGGVVLHVSMSPELKEVFYRQLGEAMITRITTMGDGLKKWSDLNPQGFAYGKNTDEHSPYLAEGENDFTDVTAMESLRADQAQVFLYAMLPEKKSRLASDTMQEKLRLLCEQIRGIYQLSDAENLPWEQHLQS